jgi:Tetraspanin family
MHQAINQRERLKEGERAKHSRGMYHHRFSNTVIGYLNLLTLLASVPLIGGGLWLAHSSSTCQSALQTPLLALGFVVFLVSLSGFVGACFGVAWALWLYLFAMLILIIALLCFTAFGLVSCSFKFYSIFSFFQ